MTTQLSPSCPAWIVLAYRLPPGSALRPLIRQRLAEAGALFLASAVAAVPAGPAGQTVARLRDMILAAGGSAQMLQADALTGGTDLADACRWARAQEHGESLAAAEPDELDEVEEAG